MMPSWSGRKKCTRKGRASYSRVDQEKLLLPKLLLKGPPAEVNLVTQIGRGGPERGGIRRGRKITVAGRGQNSKPQKSASPGELFSKDPSEEQKRFVH